jgi:tight adherence protein B
MNPLGWLALAGAVAATAPPARAARRAELLAGAGRLSSAPGQAQGPRRVPVAVVAAPGSALWVAAAGWAGGVWLGAAGAAVAGAGWVLVRGAVAQRALVADRADLLAAVRVIVAELQAGARPGAALEAAAQAGPRHSLILHAAASEAAGSGDAGAVLAAHPNTRALGVAWQLGEDLGAALAGVLERVAADLAAAEEQRRSVGVALAGPRSSAALLAGLPVVGIAMGTAMGARPVEFLTSAPPGRVVCCAGVLLDVAGVLWMRRILRTAQRP